ncbi:Hint domain-containing protein [Tropicimonas sp. TH_r6]|uniref:Hint domain-containing protein n=1 Tax=Tropicimonas sp. TH_r6 TaxID=3082085 RepID=UPI0029550844|nr:Hint domain-containing protein [Tropicimonas sp. TH_r6]MDV7145688.1 Hint domain-containing protein [Tropicimonas sp. TH_r6]
MKLSVFGAALRRPSRAVALQGDVGILASVAFYTEHGPIPACLLSPGDRVIRRGQGPVAVRQAISVAHSGRMVRIAPDALGRARPEDFLLLPPDQRLRVRKAAGADRDGVFAVRELVDDALFRWHEPPEPVQLVQLDFGGPEIVHAGGLELEFG